MSLCRGKCRRLSMVKASDSPSVLVDAMSAAKRVLEKIPAGGTPLDEVRRGEALYELGVASSGLGLHEEAAGYLKDAELTVSGLLEAQAVVTKIRLRRAAELVKLRRYEDVVVLTEQALEAGSEMGAEIVAGFQYMRCEALVPLHRWAEAYVAGRALVQTVGDSGAQLGIGEMARGYWTQGKALRELGDLDLALPVLDQAISAARALPVESDPSFRALLCGAIVERGLVLEAMQRLADAREAYAAAASEFAGDANRKIRRLARKARRRGLVLCFVWRLQSLSNRTST